MPKLSKGALVLFAGCYALITVGCRSDFFSQFGRVEADIASSTTATPRPAASATPVSQSISTTVITSANPSGRGFQQAIERASHAFTLSRSAQSQDDWKLVARRWQQAIDLMVAIPNTDPNHAQAQKKVAEYRSNLAYAQQQAGRSTADPKANGTVVIRTQPSPVTPRSNPSPSNSASGSHSGATPSRSTPPTTTATRPTTPQPQAAGGQTFYAPIIRREGNTPVIRVTFNGRQAFDMIVDTGASGTLITQSMAQALGVVPVAATRVDTASQQGVVVPLGYVNSIEVDGAVANHVLVAIAGPELSTGLLGHDFFGHYDVTIRENEVEFQVR